MGVDDPVDALQLDQALFRRLEADRLERRRAAAARGNPKGQMPAGFRGETLADLPADPGRPR